MSGGHACDIERLHGECLVWMYCDATDECQVRALLSQALPWGLAGMKPRDHDWEWGCRVFFDTQGMDSWDDTERLLGDSVPKTMCYRMP